MTYTEKTHLCPTCKTKTFVTKQTIDEFDYSNDFSGQGCPEFRVFEWLCKKCKSWKAKILLDNGSLVMEIK